MFGKKWIASLISVMMVFAFMPFSSFALTEDESAEAVEPAKVTAVEEQAEETAPAKEVAEQAEETAAPEEEIVAEESDDAQTAVAAEKQSEAMTEQSRQRLQMHSTHINLQAGHR